MQQCGGWQCGCGGAANALHAVFAWLEGEELALAAAVCRTWREAANTPVLWRAALARRVRIPQAQLRHLAAYRRSRYKVSGFQQSQGKSTGLGFSREAKPGRWKHDVAGVMTAAVRVASLT